MTEPKRLEVHGCARDPHRCPLYDGEWATCGHPDGERGPAAEIELREIAFGWTEDGEPAPPTPWWCPLKKAPVLIELVEPRPRLDKNAIEDDAAMALGLDEDDGDLPF